MLNFSVNGAMSGFAETWPLLLQHLLVAQVGRQRRRLCREKISVGIEPFDFTGPNTPFVGVKLQLPDNPLTVGKSATVTVAVYTEGSDTPVQAPAAVSIHEGAHDRHVDIPSTSPGRHYAISISTSHDIGFAVGIQGQKAHEDHPNLSTRGSHP